MLRLSGLMLVVGVIVIAMSCSPPATETEPPRVEKAAALETGPDPTVVDATHYTAEFENDRVRIVRISYGAGEESVMHYHPESVAVFLTDHAVKMRFADGSTDEVRAKAGEHLFIPAGQHLPKNITDKPWELILVELKPKGAAPTAAETGPDPTVVDAAHYTAEFENDGVRIVRIGYGAGEESVMHHHPESVAVFLADHAVKMRFSDGSTDEVRAKAGEHLFIPAGQHLPKNMSKKPSELILVELL